MRGLKELRIRLFKSTLEDLWDRKLLESLAGIQVKDDNFVLELPGVYEEEAGDRLMRPISIANTALFKIQRRTKEGDRSNVIIVPSYDPDPISWHRAVVLILRNPWAVLATLGSELAAKLKGTIEAWKRRE